MNIIGRFSLSPKFVKNRLVRLEVLELSGTAEIKYTFYEI